MARTKDPFLYPFKAGKPVLATVERVEGQPDQGFYEGEFKSERDLKEVEAAVIALRVAKILNRYGVTELHLTLEEENTNA